MYSKAEAKKIALEKRAIRQADYFSKIEKKLLKMKSVFNGYVRTAIHSGALKVRFDVAEFSKAFKKRPHVVTIPELVGKTLGHLTSAGYEVKINKDYIVISWD